MSDNLAIGLYQSISAENKPREFKNWHCSSIAECPRAQYFKRLGIPPLNVPTAAKMLRWQAGHLIEEVIRPHLLKLYPDLVSNKRYTSKLLDLTGEYDNYSEKEKMLIEVKSVHVFAPPMIEKQGAYLGHKYQNHAYKLLLEENNLPCERVTYIYIALDGRIVTVETEIDETILGNVRKRLEVLRGALAGKLPDCLCDKDHPLYKSVTQYCDYQTSSDCCNPKLLKEKV